jgi:hypothetical protein
LIKEVLTRGCLKIQNPLTSDVAKSLRKVSKELIINDLSLRALRIPLRALRLKRLFQQFRWLKYLYL